MKQPKEKKKKYSIEKYLWIRQHPKEALQLKLINAEEYGNILEEQQYNWG